MNNINAVRYVPIEHDRSKRINFGHYQQEPTFSNLYEDTGSPFQKSSVEEDESLANYLSKFILKILKPDTDKKQIAPEESNEYTKITGLELDYFG